MGQLGDLLHQIDPADDQADLGVLVLLAAVVVDPDETFDVQLRFVLVGDGDVVGLPGDAAGEIGDFDRRFAIQFALHVPIEHLRLVVGEGRVQQVSFSACVRNRSSTDVGSMSVLAQLNCSGLTPCLNVILRVSRTSVRSSLL